MKEIKLPALHMHIGDKIRILRKKKKFSKKDLAYIIGKKRPLICHIERTGTIHYHILKKICVVLDTTINRLEKVGK